MITSKKTVTVGGVDFALRRQGDEVILKIKERTIGISVTMRMTKKQAETLGEVFKVFSQ